MVRPGTVGMTNLYGRRVAGTDDLTLPVGPAEGFRVSDVLPDCGHERALKGPWSCMIMLPPGRARLLAGAGECDVPLGVGDIRADGDVSHAAAAAAVHHDGAGACLGRGEQVPGPDACLD
jgi:hypothetical protein